MGQLKMDIEKTSGEAGLKGKWQTGPVGHQWVVNATRYADKQKDYGRRWVPLSPASPEVFSMSIFNWPMRVSKSPALLITWADIAPL